MRRITLPGTYMLVSGMTHRHATAEPGTVEHNHLGGGVPHDHDPETGFQIPRNTAARGRDTSPSAGSGDPVQ